MVAGGGIEEDSSRNLLQRFGGNPAGDSPPAGGGGGNDACEIELSLGLSLNGCFGVEPRNKKLVRSSSISSLSIFPTEHNVPLTRTCSLPTETAEERWRRKEMENFKRMEAKRKRSERKAVKGRKDENFDEDLNNLNRDNNNKGGQALGGKMNGVVVNGEVGGWVMGKGVNGGKPISQGSIGSQGSSSSGVSEFDSKPIQGLDVSGLGNCAEVKSPPATIPSASSNPINHKSPTVNPPRDGDEPSRKKSCRTNGVKECERSMMEEMPCVSAKGDGPGGRRIEGFLYKYRRGEEVRIVCVCHGKFFTPAEFVKHAGGGDVAHPLRHIVVNPTPSPFL